MGFHEIMHLFGLSDRYRAVSKQWKDGTKYTKDESHGGFENDIMGANVYCTPVTQVHWNHWGNFILKNGLKSGDVINTVVDMNSNGTLKY